MEWAQAHGIRKAVAEKLTADEWKVRVLLSSKDGFVEELCKAGEKRGPAAEIWLKLQSQGTHSIWARDPVLSTLLPSSSGVLSFLKNIIARLSPLIESCRLCCQVYFPLCLLVAFGVVLGLIAPFFSIFAVCVTSLCADMVHVVLSFVHLAFGVRRNVGGCETESRG